MQNQHYKILKIWILNQKKRCPRAAENFEFELLYVNVNLRKNKHAAELLGTSNLSIKIVCSPPKSRDTVPLKYHYNHLQNSVYNDSLFNHHFNIRMDPFDVTMVPFR